MTYRALLSLTVSAGMGFVFLPAFADAEAGQADSAQTQWAQWRRPNRDGVSTETGLLTTWPEGGPEVVWGSPIGGGYSSVAIAGGRLYTMAGQGADEFVLCLDAVSGVEVWRI